MGMSELSNLLFREQKKASYAESAQSHIFLPWQDKTLLEISPAFSGLHGEYQRTSCVYAKNIELSYSVHQIMLLASGQAAIWHSLSPLQSTSMTSLENLQIQDICKAVTWLSIHTFTKHYVLVQPDRVDARYGRRFLQSIFTEAPHTCPNVGYSLGVTSYGIWCRLALKEEK